MALCKSAVLKVYNSVIEDVISGVRDIFTDEGLDEQVLQELKMLWESKLMASKAVESTQESTDLKTGASKKVEPAVNGAVYNGGIHAKQQQYVKTTPAVLQPATAIQSTSTLNMHAEDKMIPIQITLPAQPTIDSATRVLTIHVPTSALNGPQLHTLLTGPVITATMGLPATLASSLLQQHVNAALQSQQNAINIAQNKTAVLQGMDVNNSIKLDGATDTSDEDEDGSEDEASDEEGEDEKEDEDADVMDDQTNEEEPLNSEDDVTDEEPADLFDTDNVVVCQYDKITRSRNKWKFHLKDGIMNLEGEDFLFQKANGDAEW